MSNLNETTTLSEARYKRALNSFRDEQSKNVIANYIPDSEKFRSYLFFGGNLEFMQDTSKEKVIQGPAETGKTIACLYLLNKLAWENPGMQGAIIRNVRQDLYGSALVTFHEKVLPRNPVTDPFSKVRAYGGHRPERYIYPNRSVIWVGGLDKPGSALSQERDIIYVNQAEEISETARNKLLTRVTGRAGVLKNAQLIYDMNPGDPDLWAMNLYLEGKLKMYQSKHKDNPLLYKVDPVTLQITDELTEQGIVTMSTLNNLTGTDRDRLRDGLWVRESGLIYGDVWLDSGDGNVTESADYIPGAGEIYWSVDDGYSGRLDDSGYFSADSHPRAFGIYQMRADGTLCLFYENYAIKTLSDIHLSGIIKYSEEYKLPNPEFVAVDKSAAELKGRLHAKGFYTRNSPSSVEESIKELRRWIAEDENGKRRFLVHPRCRHSRKEYSKYRKDDKGKIIKAHDHGPDRDRYLVWNLRFMYDD